MTRFVACVLFAVGCLLLGAFPQGPGLSGHEWPPSTTTRTTTTEVQP